MYGIISKYLKTQHFLAIFFLNRFLFWPWYASIAFWSILPRSMLLSVYEGCQISKKCPYWAKNFPSLDMPNNMDLGKMLCMGIETYHGHDKLIWEKKLELKWPENVDFSNISKYPIHFLWISYIKYDPTAGGGVKWPQKTMKNFSKLFMIFQHKKNKCELLWTCDKLKWIYHNSAKFKGEVAN